MGPEEETGRRCEASGSALTRPVREYSARNWPTERIKIIDAEEVGCGGGAWVAAAKEVMVEFGGADIAGRPEASGCGCGEIGRDEVEGPVAIIGEGVGIIGDVVGIIGEGVVR